MPQNFNLGFAGIGHYNIKIGGILEAPPSVCSSRSVGSIKTKPGKRWHLSTRELIFSLCSYAERNLKLLTTEKILSDKMIMKY